MRVLPAAASRGRGRAHRVFHPLAGADMRTLVTALWRNGGVAPGRAHVAAIALATAALRLPFTATERAVLRVRDRVAPPAPAPVFVVGHWRSGTTHLANLLARSGAFGILPPIAVGMPWEALGLARLARPFVEQFFPRNRLIDDMALAPDSPQEDELALASMTTPSFYHGIYFPRHLDRHFARGLFFEGCTAAEIERWTATLQHYVAKMSWHQGGRRLLIRNPAHSTHLARLHAMWPDARFIHIHRNPYAVHASSRRLFATLLRELALQDAEPDLDALVLRTYPRLMSRLVADAAALPSGRFAEIGLDALRRDPSRELGRLYAELELPGFAEARPHFAAYLEGVRSFRGAAHAFPPAQVRQVRDNWGPFIERWRYPAPGEA